MTRNDDEAALAFGEAGIAEDAFDAATYVRDLREAGYVVARLSHGRGADAETTTATGRWFKETYGGRGFVSASDLKAKVRALAHLTPEDWKERRGADPIARTINAVFDIIDEYAALSVPAPTLPALDADLLARAMTAHAATHKVHSRSHVRASCAISIAEQYEALRDAV